MLPFELSCVDAITLNDGHKSWWMDRHVCMLSLAHLEVLDCLKWKLIYTFCVDVIFASLCVCAWQCVVFVLWVWLSVPQKMEQHVLYRPPSEERLSPGQQPPSPCVKGSQRVVTLAQHISVSRIVAEIIIIICRKYIPFVVKGSWYLMYVRQMCLYGNRRW